MSTESPSIQVALELDPERLKLNESEAAFFKQQTGISDDEELRQHILQVQADAWKVSSALKLNYDTMFLI